MAPRAGQFAVPSGTAGRNQNEPPEPPPPPKPPPPPPPPKFAQFVQQKQSPIENRVVEEASRVAPPVAIQPVQVASVQPTVVVETAVKTVTPK